MKSLLFSMAGKVSCALPIKLRHFIVKSLLTQPDLVDLSGLQYISFMSRQLNIAGIMARGKYGLMSGSPDDIAIFKYYSVKGVWAPELNSRLIEFFSGGQGTYLDIGANIGMTVVPIARARPGVTCHAFEPAPGNFQNLVRNVAGNCSDSNVKTYNVALHEREAILPFELSTENYGDHRLHMETRLQAKTGENNREIIEVSCVPLDNIGLSVKGPLFAKVDTQGAEPFVINGGRKVLASVDALLIEWSPYHMARLGSDPNVVLKFLEENFRYALIEETDSGTSTNTIRKPIGEVIPYLRQTIDLWRDDLIYLDIFAEKA